MCWRHIVYFLLSPHPPLWKLGISWKLTAIVAHNPLLKNGLDYFHGFMDMMQICFIGVEPEREPRKAGNNPSVSGP
jgi:hypothetical protein